MNLQSIRPQHNTLTAEGISTVTYSLKTSTDEEVLNIITHEEVKERNSNSERGSHDSQNGEIYVASSSSSSQDG